MLKAIACVTKNRAIGSNGNLIFRIAEDMRFFKKTTIGHTVVMGSNTYDSIGKPLPDRDIIVITKDPKKYDDVFANNIRCKATDDINLVIELSKIQDVFIAGGGEIYKLLLPYTEELLLTVVDVTAEGADTFFPPFEDNFELVDSSSEQTYGPFSNHTVYTYRFQTWKHKSNSVFDKQSLSELFMEPSAAMDMLFNGTDIKLPSWDGYWHYNEDTKVVEMHCKDGSIIDIRDTDRIEYTMKNIVSHEWLIATPANTPILGGEAWMSYGDALGYIERGLSVQSEYMYSKAYIRKVEADIIVDGKALGTEEHIALFNENGYVGYYNPTQTDIRCKWRFYKEA